jgi:hypothetical protein
MIRGLTAVFKQVEFGVTEDYNCVHIYCVKYSCVWKHISQHGDNANLWGCSFKGMKTFLHQAGYRLIGYVFLYFFGASSGRCFMQDFLWRYVVPASFLTNHNHNTTKLYYLKCEILQQKCSRICGLFIRNLTLLYLIFKWLFSAWT